MAADVVRQPVRQIGRYTLKVKSGEGASGVVYRAFDLFLDRDFAIKLARTQMMSDDDIKHVVEEFHTKRRLQEILPKSTSSPFTIFFARAA